MKLHKFVYVATAKNHCIFSTLCDFRQRVQMAAKEHFELSSKQVEIYEKGMKVMRKKSGQSSVFGTYAVDCKNSSSIICWKFKVIKLGFKTGVGLIDSSNMNVFQDSLNFAYEEDAASYAYLATGHIYQDGDRLFQPDDADYETGDIIDMELNCKDKTLNFYKNGGESVYEIKNIRPLKYKMAVHLYTEHDDEDWTDSSMALEKFENFGGSQEPEQKIPEVDKDGVIAELLDKIEKQNQKIQDMTQDNAALKKVEIHLLLKLLILFLSLYYMGIYIGKSKDAI